MIGGGLPVGAYGGRKDQMSPADGMAGLAVKSRARKAAEIVTMQKVAWPTSAGTDAFATVC